MNKKLILSLLFPILIAACSSPKLQEPEVVIDVPTSKSFVGTVNKLSVPLNNLDSDYYLLTDSKNRIYLNSLIHNLNDYIDYEVRLRGQLVYSDLAGKQVEILNVEQIDIITSPQIVSDVLSYESASFGVEFEYLSSFDLEEFSSQVSLSDPSSRQLIKLSFIDKTENQDMNYDDYIDSLSLSVPRENFATNNHRFDLYNISNDTIKYFLESNKYILEITYVFLDSSYDGLAAFDEFLNSINLSDLEIKEQNLEAEENTNDLDNDNTESELDLDEKTEQSTDANSETSLDLNSNSISEEQIDDSSDLVVDLSDFDNSVDSEFLKVINEFETNIGSYVDSFQNSVSYSFTDNNEFYLIYLDENDNQKRILVDYSSEFKVVATFKEGSVADWDLVDGVNIAFDRPLTVLNKNDNEFLPSISLKEGFRLFESLAMKIQSFYPTDWYYSRQDDVYIFSSDPKTFEPSMLITLLDVSASLPYADLETNESVQVSNNIFVKKLNAGFFKLEFKTEFLEASYILDSLRDV